MLDSFAIPATVFRAYKPLIMGKGKASPSNRIAEFVRLGVTAYDFTLTYSDQIILVHTSWPKPKDMGNAHEGWFSYLTKDEFAALPYNPKSGAVSPIFGSGVCPFQRDILRKDAVQTLFDVQEPKRDKRKAPTFVKSVNPKHLTRVSKALETMCKGGAAGGYDAAIKLNIGTDELRPLRFDAFVKRDMLTIAALVMPVWM